MQGQCPVVLMGEDSAKLFVKQKTGAQKPVKINA